MDVLPNSANPDSVRDDTRDNVRARLAPSPTGRLHLGNAWAFLMAWLLCRRAGGRLVLRLEDIDPDRSRPEYAAAIIDDLHWLGLDWDEGPDVGGAFGPYIQSARTAHYAAALAALKHAGHTYPCFCTRRELRARHASPSSHVDNALSHIAGAPHIGDEGAPYPGTCRGYTEAEQAALRAAGRKASIRLICPDQAACFTDSVWGEQCLSAATGGGDFALCRSDGVVAYQLAVVVDDGAMHISQVVRGRDILSSTPRQLLLQRLLGLPMPTYTHVPLLCDHQGERLAKRHQSLSLAALREAGVDPRAVTGYLAMRAGLIGDGTDACVARNPAALREKGELSFLLRVMRDAALPPWWRERDILLDADPLAVLRTVR